MSFLKRFAVPLLLISMAIGVPVFAAELDNTSSGQWSETDANNTSPAPDGWISGTMLPSQVEPTARSMMGSIKRFWDRINGTITSTGSAGAYVYTPVNNAFPTALVQGETYSWRANFTSVGNDTLQINANSLPAKALFKPSSSGPVQIVAGDIVTGQYVVAMYDATLASGAGGFQIVSAIANGVSAALLPPSGSMMAFGGVTAPSGWLLANGQTVSRTSFATLFSAITVQESGTLSNGSAIVTGLAATGNLQVGFPVCGTGVPAATTILSIDSSSQIHLSANATVSGSEALVFAPWGAGDCVTNFVVPDLRGRTVAGVDNMGGIGAAGRLGLNFAGGVTTAAILGASGGQQAHTMTVSELVQHNHAVGSLSVGTTSALLGGVLCTTCNAPISIAQLVQADAPSITFNATGGVLTSASSISGSVANTGSTTPFNVTPPVAVTNWIIKTSCEPVFAPANDRHAWPRARAA